MIRCSQDIAAHPDDIEFWSHDLHAGFCAADADPLAEVLGPEAPPPETAPACVRLRPPSRTGCTWCHKISAA